MILSLECRLGFNLGHSLALLKIRRFFMKRKLSFCLVLLLVFASFAFSAMASKAVTFFCSSCEKNVSATAFCPGAAQRNTAYSWHNTSEGICNYYTKKLNMQAACPTCGNIWQYNVYHDHVQIHQCIIGARMVCIE